MTTSDDRNRDRELAARVLQGDESAFREFVTQHKRRVFSMAYRLTGNTHDADEVAQEVFLRAHRGLARFRGQASLATWLTRITVNTARTHRRRAGWAQREVAVDRDALERLYRPKEDKAGVLVSELLDELSQDHREALVLFAAEGYKVKEISEMLNVPEGTVKSRICYAKRRLARLAVERGVAP